MTFLWNIRSNLRLIARSPGYGALVVATLALGIGLTTAVFGLVNSVILQPLPYPEPERLVSLWESQRGTDGEPSCAAAFLFWKKHSRGFQQIAAYQSYAPNLTGLDRAVTLLGCQVSANIFRLLRTEALMGRTFSDSDDHTGADPVALLGHGFWKGVFAGDPSIVGKTIMIGGTAHTVIGVMPADFRLALPRVASRGEIEVLTPLRFTAQEAENRVSHYLGVVGRLSPGVSLEQGREELRILTGRLNQTDPDHFQSALAVPLKEELVQDLPRTFAVAFGSAACVLLIACANVINLMLSNLVGRRKELAIREAIGAGRWRLAREFLTGSLLLALIGGMLGALFSSWVMRLFIALSPMDIPRIRDTGFGWQVAGFSLGVCLLAGLLNGCVVLWARHRHDLASTLAENGQRAYGTGGARGRRIRALLVAAQMALATMLTIAASLLAQDLYKLRSVDPGFRTDHLLTARVRLTSRYSPPQAVSFYARMLERLQALPEVEYAEVCSDFPLAGSVWGSSVEFAQRPPGLKKTYTAIFQIVSPGYFQALRIPLIQGRFFDSSDDERIRTVIINQAMAQRLWPGESPIGRRIKIHAAKSEWFDIVGVVGSTRFRGLGSGFAGEIYVPYRQTSSTDLGVVLRSSGDTAFLADALRREVWELDPEQPVARIKTMDKTLWDSLAEPRFHSVLFGFFSILALFLSMLGIYGVLAYSVASRTHEMGVRIALGAQTSEIFKLVVGEGMRLALGGIFIGLIAAFGLTRLLSSLLFGLSATDPMTFGVVAVLLALVALFACYSPARRATKVDPMVALRYE